MIMIKKLQPIMTCKHLLLVKKPELYLATSIILETACTFGLSNVNQNKLLYIPIYLGYGISFYLFPKSLERFSLNVAYTLWSGVGIIFTLLLDIMMKKDILTIAEVNLVLINKLNFSIVRKRPELLSEAFIKLNG